MALEITGHGSTVQLVRALIFLWLWLSEPSRVSRVPRGEVLALGVFGVAESIAEVVFVRFPGFWGQSHCGNLAFAFCVSPLLPSPPHGALHASRLSRASRTSYFFLLLGFPWGRLLVGHVLRVLQGFLLGTGAENTEGGWLP